MAEEARAAPGTTTRRALRTPRAAGIAGIVFSVVFIVGLVLLRTAVPADPDDAGEWLTDRSRARSVLLALSLVPFAGIAFLWFIGVLRDRIGEREDRFFATVFLGSGLLFVATLFVAAAVAGGLVATAARTNADLIGSGVWGFGRRVSFDLMNIFAMRMAAVFTISTSTVLLHGRLVPRWFALAGYVIALAMLVGMGFVAWLALLFPAWVLVLSLFILVASVRGERGRAQSPV